MKLIHNLLDYSVPWQLPDVFLFTGNPVIKRNGAIVMGRGAAKQVRDTYPGIDKSFGVVLTKKPEAVLAWVSVAADQHLGWFKVKQHWQNNASLELITYATEALMRVAETHPATTFHMNFPGIGNGKLNSNAVLPILHALPDNVWVYLHP